MVAAAVIGGTVSGVMSSKAQSDAADSASSASSAASNAQIAESQRQFDSIQKLLAPYTDAGPGALSAQQDLLGLNGNLAENDAINGIANSAKMQYLTQQGENALRQNASATGGLRGGNLQGALAQFRPQLLNQLIDQQYQRLGGLTNVGQNSANQIVTAQQNSSGQIINALGQQGAAQAGNALAQGKIQADKWNNVAQGFGMYGGLNGVF